VTVPSRSNFFNFNLVLKYRKLNVQIQYSMDVSFPMSSILHVHGGYIFLFFILIKVWWHAATLFIYFYINRADNTYVHVQHIFTSRRVPLLLPSLLPLGGWSPLGCRAEIRTRACRTASRCATTCATPHPMIMIYANGLGYENEYR
jgi:hypothetical protein